MCLRVWSNCRYIGSLSKQHSKCLWHPGRVFILFHSLICSRSKPFRLEEQLLSAEGEIFLLTRRIWLSGHLLRIEPSNVKWMHKFLLALERVKKIGWYNMFKRIAEHHVEVTKAFFQSFNGSRVRIGGLSFIVTEETISHAIGVLLEGERWYKRQTIHEYYSQYLLPAHKNPDWSQGIQRSFLFK